MGFTWRLCLLIPVVLTGCGASRPTADSVAGALFDAMEAGDAAALGRATGRSEAETLELLAIGHGEVAEAARLARSRRLETRGRAYLAGGGVVGLVHEEGGWRIASGLLGVPSLETPEDAIRALHTMLSRVEETGLESIFSRETRLALHEEFERWTRGTADPDAISIEVDGDTAIATTPSGGTIELVREGGEWRVVDLR